jgi:hypothetical protein
MITGKGTLVLRSGRNIPVEYQFGGKFDDTRIGYLVCDASEIDTLSLCERLRVICDDGSELLVAVMHSSDRYLAITGRVVQKEAA